MKRSVCIVLIMLATACGVQQTVGSPFSLSSDEFPIIMLQVDSTAFYAAMANIGIDYVHNYGMGRSADPAELRNKCQFLDEALHYGLKVMVNLDGVTWVKNPDGVDQMRTVIREYKDHPALGFWYLFDEPHNHDIRPAQTRPFYKMIKAEAPGIQVATVHAWNNTCDKYVKSQDILMTDYYSVFDKPFPEANIRNTTVSTRYALDETRQPVIPMLQCYPRGAENRYPVRAELRYWAYSSLVMGVRALSWYSRGPSFRRDRGRWFNGTFGPMCKNLRTFVDDVEPAHKPETLMDGTGSKRCFLGIWKRRTDTWVVLVNNRNTAKTLSLSMKNKIREANLIPCKGTRDVNAQIRLRRLKSIPMEPWETFVWKVVPVGAQ